MTIKKLNALKENKLLIVHADDAGLSHAQNRAIITCLEQGVVNSFSIMVPCLGFDEIASYAMDNPSLDYGVHLTLTCEWEKHRFGPVSPLKEVESLVDEHGHFYKTRGELAKYAQPEEVRKELQAQIAKAITYGLNPTHLDSHMYSVGAREEFFEIYKELGELYDLPLLINKTLMEMVGLNVQKNLPQEGLITDHAYVANYEDFENQKLRDYYLRCIEHLKDGLNIILIHPAYDDEEMKELTVNHPNFGSEWRQIDLEVFTSEEVKDKLHENNIQLITWRELKEMDNVSK